MEYEEKLAIEEVIAAIKVVLPQQNQVIALHEPLFQGNEERYMRDCIDTGWVSSVGSYVDSFEKKLAEYTGVKRAVAVVNGTAALHISLLLAGVGKDDEVIIPALTFIATANAVMYCNAVPHFVDSSILTLGMDGEKLDEYLADIAVMHEKQCYNRRTGRRIAAILPMHTFGHAVEIDTLIAVCDKYHIVLVEDAAESIGTYYKGVHTGNFGKVAAMSFNGNKTITTGGGGAVLTNDEELGKLAKHLTTQAKVPHKWEFNHDMIGYNYRMPNINAALGCAQLEQLSGFVNRKRELAEKYKKAFENVAGIKFFTEPSFSTSNYWLNAIILDDKYAYQRDELLEMLNSSNIMARPVWNLLYHLPMYKDCPRMQCDIAENIAERLINIPSSVKLG